MKATIAPDSPGVLRELSAAVLRVLAYFDVFKHPLTAQEVFEYCDYPPADVAAVQTELAELSRLGCVREEGGYYALDAGSSVDQRQRAAARCTEYLRQGYRYSRLIARFPFVRGVGISGSLSKGVAEANADVDYFIITAPGRLWVCRTLLTLFKKTVLLNSHKYFCLNYFVDTDHLPIPDQNIFTATEIAFLIPTYDYGSYVAFLHANHWVGSYYPNKPPMPAEAVFEQGNSRLKRWAEALLGGRFGEWLEARCLRLTRDYRRRRFSHLSKSEFQHAMRATPGVAKHHPNSFQGRVLRAYEHRLAVLQHQLGGQLI